MYKNIYEKDLYETFNKKIPKSIERFKMGSVMILIEYIEGEPYIIFEVRSEKLRHQPGEICLPGGKVENTETPKDAALRETIEELNLLEKDINIIGESDYLVTPYGMIVYVFIGILRGEIKNCNKAEVDHIFKVPLSYFIDNEPILYNMEIGPTNQNGFPFHLIKRGKQYDFSKGYIKEFFYEYNDYVIWGITAHIIKSFISIINRS